MNTVINFLIVPYLPQDKIQTPIHNVQGTSQTVSACLSRSICCHFRYMATPSHLSTPLCTTHTCYHFQPHVITLGFWYEFSSCGPLLHCTLCFLYLVCHCPSCITGKHFLLFQALLMWNLPGPLHSPVKILLQFFFVEIFSAIFSMFSTGLDGVIGI